MTEHAHDERGNGGTAPDASDPGGIDPGDRFDYINSENGEEVYSWSGTSSVWTWSGSVDWGSSSKHGDASWQDWKNSGWGSSSSWGSKHGSGKQNTRPPPKLKSTEKKDYRKWKSAIENWTFTTDIDPKKWATEIKQQIEVDEATDIVELIKKSVLHTVDGYEALLKALDDEYLGERRDTMWDKFMNCVIQGKRKPNQTMREFLLNYSTKLKELDNELSEGHTLPEELKGLLIAYEAGLDNQQLENLMSITNLSWTGKDVERGLKRMNVTLAGMGTKATSSKVFLATETVDEESEPADEEGIEGTVGQVSDADTVGSSECEVFFSKYKDSQAKYWELLKKRGFYKSTPKFQDRMSKFGTSASPSSSNRPSSKQSMQRLAPVPPDSKCGRCGQPGHWKRECPNAYKPKSGPTYSSSAEHGDHGSLPNSNCANCDTTKDISVQETRTGSNLFEKNSVEFPLSEVN